MIVLEIKPVNELRINGPNTFPFGWFDEDHIHLDGLTVPYNDGKAIISKERAIKLLNLLMIDFDSILVKTEKVNVIMRQK